MDIISVSGATSFDYAYDANGRKTSETDSVIAGLSQTFSYDDADRLTSWSKPSGGSIAAQSQTWTLTKVGDWSQTTINGGTPQNRTHNGVHELTAIDSSVLGYDAKGNLSQDDTTGQRYRWDPENRLAQVNVPAFGAGPGSLGVPVVATYQYDALGRRLAKTVQGLATRFLHDGAQVVYEVDAPVVPSQAEVNGADSDGTAANASLPPASGGTLRPSSGTVTRINFQPVETAIPAGYYADKGKTYAMRTNGLTYGWSASQAGRQQARNYQTLPELDTCIRAQPTSGDTPGTWEIALPNGTYPVVVVCGDPLSTLQTNDILIEGTAYADPDPSTTAGYTQGDFDGYAATVVISDGKLTIEVDSGADDPKLCFIEIGPEGTSVDSGVTTRLSDLVSTATDATWETGRVINGTRNYVYGSYVDEPLLFMNGSAKYYPHANSLYSVSALTNTSGVVIERYRYNAYGRQTIMDASGVALARSAYGHQRGFTGYILDHETGLLHARARQYSAVLGRFIGRDKLDYADGYGLYQAYFVPWTVDPSGMTCNITVSGKGDSKNKTDSNIQENGLDIKNGAVSTWTVSASAKDKTITWTGKITLSYHSAKNPAGSKAVTTHEISGSLTYTGEKTGNDSCKCCKLSGVKAETPSKTKTAGAMPEPQYGTLEFTPTRTNPSENTETVEVKVKVGVPPAPFSPTSPAYYYAGGDATDHPRDDQNSYKLRREYMYEYNLGTFNVSCWCQK